jgi:hypothetical protein
MPSSESETRPLPQRGRWPTAQRCRGQRLRWVFSAKRKQPQRGCNGRPAGLTRLRAQQATARADKRPTQRGAPRVRSGPEALPNAGSSCQWDFEQEAAEETEGRNFRVQIWDFRFDSVTWPGFIGGDVRGWVKNHPGHTLLLRSLCGLLFKNRIQPGAKQCGNRCG